jgi:23S rRNA pseudouridine2457 synthase
VHIREYWVQVDGQITPAAMHQLQRGIDISVDGKIYRTKECKGSIFESAPSVPERIPPIRYRRDIPTSWIKLLLTEGKNRQVRKMTAAVGFPTLRLIRYSIGKLTIDDLKPAEYRNITGVKAKELLLRMP